MTMLVMQVARVHAVVWEKGDEIASILAQLRAHSPDAARAGCLAFAKRLIGQVMCMARSSMHPMRVCTRASS